jgi:hypothetical protein
MADYSNQPSRQYAVERLLQAVFPDDAGVKKHGKQRMGMPSQKPSRGL